MAIFAQLVLLVFLTGNGTPSSFMQKPQWQIREFHAPDELSHEEIWQIVQTRDGAVWFATGGGGVTRLFEGKRTVYDCDRGLIGNYVRCLKEDSLGGVWAGTSVGISYIYRDAITNFSSKANPEILDDSIATIDVDSQGRVWFGTGLNHLFYFIPRAVEGNRPIGNWALPPKQIEGKNIFQKMIFDKQDNLWIAHDFHGLRLWPKNGEEKCWKWNETNVTYDLVPTRDGSIWLCGANLLVQYKDGEIRKVDKRKSIFSALGELEGHLLAGTFTDGLFLYENGDLISIPLSDEHPRPYIECIYPTRDGAVWIGTREGAYRISRSPWHFLGSMPGGSRPQARTLIKNASGDLYLIDDLDALFRRQGSLWEKVADLPIPKNDSDSQQPARATRSASETIYYFHNFGIYQFDLSKPEALLKIPWPDSQELKYDDKNGIYVSRDGGLWLYCYLGAFHWQENKWVAVPQFAERKMKHVFAIVEPQRDVFWLLGRGWIDVWKENRIDSLALPKSYTDYTDEWSKLWCATEHDGAWWIGTDRNGLLKFDGARWEHFHQKDGIPGEGISALYSARNGALWVGSYRSGISSFKEGRWVTYGLKEGIPNGQIDRILEDNEGTIWIEIRYSGVACYTPDRGEPVVWMESESTNMLPDERGVFSANAWDAWNQTERTDLAYSWRVVDSKRQTAVLDWTAYSPKNTITTSPMKPGAYQIQFRAQDKDRNTSKSCAVAEFVVQPYFGTTPQFLIPVILSAGVAFVSLLVWRRKHIALIRSEWLYRNLVEKDTVTLMVNWNRRGDIIYCNECSSRFFGAAESELVGSPVRRWLAGNNRKSIELFEEVLGNALLAPDVPQECRLPIEMAGEERWLSWFIRLIDSGNASDYEIHAVGVEITQQVQTEKSLLREKMSFQEFCDSVQIGVMRLDAEGRILYRNSVMDKLVGFENGGGFSFEDIRWQNPAAARSLLRKLESSSHPLTQLLTGFRLDDGEPFSILSSGQQKGGQIELLFLDYTEQKRLEEKLAQASSLEQERLGRELHDGLGQQLTGLAYLGSLIEKKLQNMDGGYAELARELNQNLKTALEQTRNLSRGLYPVSLERSGLKTALEELIASYQCTYPTAIRLDFNEAIPVESNYLPPIYRIVREACFNALKHAEPKVIHIRIDSTAEKLIVQISDDGIGFPGGLEQPPETGMGVQIMKYYAQMIDGELRFAKNPSGGSIVELSCMN